MTRQTTTQLDARARARAYAPAKINLGLFVGPVRERDGRHELVSVMQSISLADEIALEPVDPTVRSEDEIVCPGVPGEPGSNLAARALRAYREATDWDPGPLRLTIDKRIPVAAGLGGGSADAAATLRLASHLHGSHGGSPELLIELAEGLGADVPAQVAPGRWLATGAGELLEELPAATAPDETLEVLVLPVAAELSTAAVYARADELGVGRSIEELRQIAAELKDALGTGASLPQAQGRAQGLLRNDLQEAAISLCPQIEPTLDLARETGADAVFVSGSGPTIVALFTGEHRAYAHRAAEQLQGRSPAPIWASTVTSAFAQAGNG